MEFVCPVCNIKNQHQLDFIIEEYVCSSCYNLIDVRQNKSRKQLPRQGSNVVLDTTKRGIIDGVEYFVVAVTCRNYANVAEWREYFLKDKDGNNAFLSESDGHWVFLKLQDEAFNEHRGYCDFKGKLYRHYETTPSSVSYLEGFFEDRVSFKVATYKEYVNGTEMVSWEQSGSGKVFFWGKHISKYKIKQQFLPNYMPSYQGIGIVQPFYVNIKQVAPIFVMTVLLMTLFQIFVTSNNNNKIVFDQRILYRDIFNKELITKSFSLEGASAPMQVKLATDVDNSWASIELSLVNEKTNEVTYATKDIEYYHGYESGESWSEGSKTEKFNLCGVAPGNYHFVIAAQKEKAPYIYNDVYISEDRSKSYVMTNDGFMDVIENPTGDKMAINLSNLENNNPVVFKELEAAKLFTKNNPSAVLSINEEETNTDFGITAEWLPVSYRNFVIIIIVILALGIGLYFLKGYFDTMKWKNSSNSPY
ncbi:DUF4178 domain-containing protein [Chryseobacterium sp. POL2]|uniref:DUF4178 domain-containing protein n=1 Tax=Chryseobacterium sp. POL2 TaxID=2713414 RepID=UPI0013E1BCF3|nr:DUF4178 domain-containing protein [Chryseobacterium sp. POL2]QIG90208.1 DUF4178 domain-containing protein [Chryseobacterium sp. POL2]